MALSSVSISSILNGLRLHSDVHVQFHKDMYSSSIVFISGPKCYGDLCLRIQFPMDICTIMMVVVIFGGNSLKGLSKHA